MQTSMKQLKKDRNSLKESYLPKKKSLCNCHENCFTPFLVSPFFCITKPLSKNYNDRSKNTLNIEFESSCVDLHLVRKMLLKCKWKSLFCFFVCLFEDFLYLIIIMLDILILIFWSSYTSTVVLPVVYTILKTQIPNFLNEDLHPAQHFKHVPH